MPRGYRVQRAEVVYTPEVEPFARDLVSRSKRWLHTAPGRLLFAQESHCSGNLEWDVWSSIESTGADGGFDLVALEEVIVACEDPECDRVGVCYTLNDEGVLVLRGEMDGRGAEGGEDAPPSASQQQARPAVP